MQMNLTASLHTAAVSFSSGSSKSLKHLDKNNVYEVYMRVAIDDMFQK